jgi:beta-glucosidase
MKTFPVMRNRISWRVLAALAGAVVLGACSSSTDLKSTLAGSAQAAPLPPPAPVVPDVATSNVVHPEIWPQAAGGVARDPAVEAEVARLLSQMTLEEKVGQIIQADLNSITPEEVRQYHIGSILVGGDDGPFRNDRAPASEWLKAADAYYDASVDVAPGRPVIPVIWGIDAVHGNNNIIGATIFPHNIGLGAMRDPVLMRQIGDVTAKEVRVTGQDWAFAPTIAVVRDVRWGRTYESYGDNPALVSGYATAMVEGLQGKPGDPDFLKNGHVIATAKHFIGDGGTDHGTDQGDNLYSEPALRDIFAPPYEAAIKAGVQSVMVSYSSWRGTKMHANRSLLTDVLVGRLGFDGFTVGDWDAHAQLPGCSKVDCPITIDAGLDMVMISGDWKVLYANTLAEVKAGTIPMFRLDDAVAHILRVKLRAGVMSEGRPSARPYAGHWDQLGSPEHRAVARQAVRESLVLLKNDGGLLPLSPRAHVLVTGEGADNLAMQAGGWTISWQGNDNTRADFPHASTIYEGIRAEVQAAGGVATLSPDGSYTDRPDVAIVVFGEQSYAEGRGDRTDLDFSRNDAELAVLQRLKAQGIPIVSVFLSGRPLYVTPEINASNAFVAAWLPGSEGEGISDVLFSKPDGSVASDFRGGLSFSWPRAPDQTSLNPGTEPYYPLFAYGYGLTYDAPRNIGQLPLAPLPPAPPVVATPAADIQIVTPTPKQSVVPSRHKPRIRVRTHTKAKLRVHSKPHPKKHKRHTR